MVIVLIVIIVLAVVMLSLTLLAHNPMRPPLLTIARIVRSSLIMHPSPMELHLKGVTVVPLQRENLITLLNHINIMKREIIMESAQAALSRKHPIQPTLNHRPAALRPQNQKPFVQHRLRALPHHVKQRLALQNRPLATLALLCAV
ncbi:MAG: hypothetical protein ACKVOH_05160 [Chlamydiales bacterium]